MKSKWTCPNCQQTLKKLKKDGESIKRCPSCGASWFIILSRPPTDTKKTDTQLELFSKDIYESETIDE